MTIEVVGVAAEVGGLALEAAKPVYGTLQKVYKTKSDRKQFRDILHVACVRGGIGDEPAGKVSDAIVRQINEALRQSSTRVRKATWFLRADRGPGIDRLPTTVLNKWLDDLYVHAVDQEKVVDAPPSISGLFRIVLGGGFLPGEPAVRAAYARKLLNTLERNDSEYHRYLATGTVIGGGVALTGVGGAFMDGAHGAVDTDLKTALTIIAGTTLTALFAAFSREIERRLAARQVPQQK